MKKSRWKLYLTIIGSLIVTILCSAYFKGKKGDFLATFVITETGKFTSLDPLDGDSSQNLPVARMLYATPVEISSDNTLGSHVLESFEYNVEKKSIEWFVRNDLTYSDGSVISADDVAFAVARMAFSRPGFPVIRLIKGLKEWLRSDSPLKSYPEGIKISGNKIMIQLTEDYPHPQFRFCL
jgi:ABC-type transport system substrate-binding protein